MRNLLSTRLAAPAVCCVSIMAATPSPVRAELIYGITASVLGGPQTLVRFDSATPDAVTTVATLTGMPAGHFAAGMDFRPATGQLYVGAAGPNDSGGFAAQPYTVNLATGAMTPVGDPFDPLEFGAGVPSFDFDPVRDEMRVLTTPTDKPPVTTTRYDPDTFVLISVDAALAFDPNGPGAAFNPPFAIGAAYSNNVAGAASTTLYAYELGSDLVVTVGGIDGDPSADGGEMLLVGKSDFVVPGYLDSFGFDISGATGVAYVSTFVEGLLGVRLFTVNLQTGAMSDVGEIVAPDAGVVTDISVNVPEPTSLMTAAMVVSLNCSAAAGAAVAVPTVRGCYGLFSPADQLNSITSGRTASPEWRNTGPNCAGAFLSS